LYQTRLENERVNREITIASEMQQRLLPKQLPRIDGYEVAAEAHPCYSIGGDFYDIVRMDEHRYAFVMADVSGKGIPAAMLVSTLHASLRVYLQDPKGLSERQRLAELVSKLNTLVYENSPAERFITFVIVVLDVLTHRAAFVNAGHNPPYMHSAGTNAISSLEATGIPLGLIETSSYDALEVKLASGDTLLLYTDGITEAMNRSKAQFGDERLKKLLAQSSRAGADRVRGSIIGRVRRFQGNEPASDDLTLLVLKRSD
jgi:sigma-B regulation protein RsbU (phosphoserine phosphatase)